METIAIRARVALLVTSEVEPSDDNDNMGPSITLRTSGDEVRKVSKFMLEEDPWITVSFSAADHYAEAEMLRSGIESYITVVGELGEDTTAPDLAEQVGNDLQRLVDGIDAAASFAWLEAVDSIVKPVLALLDEDQWTFCVPRDRIQDVRNAIEGLPEPFKQAFLRNAKIGQDTRRG